MPGHCELSDKAHVLQRVGLIRSSRQVRQPDRVAGRQGQAREEVEASTPRLEQRMEAHIAFKGAEAKENGEQEKKLKPKVEGGYSTSRRTSRSRRRRQRRRARQAKSKGRVSSLAPRRRRIRWRPGSICRRVEKSTPGAPRHRWTPFTVRLELGQTSYPFERDPSRIHLAFLS